MKIGIFLPNIGHNQLAIDTITKLNGMVVNKIDPSPSIFYKEIQQPIIRPRTICTSFDKLYQYDGHLITTNLDTTHIALSCKMLKSINFYISELEWTKGVGNYLANVTLYKNKNIKLYVPSKEFQIALDNYCGIQPTVINGLDINEIINATCSRPAKNV